MLVKGLFMYPWDLIDNGLDQTADELQDMGISFISVAAVYHQAKMLLPHDPRCRMFVHPSSRCYFPFRRTDYGRLTPMRGEVLDYYDGHFWDEMVDCFHRRNIRVCAWVVVFHSSRLAGMNPDCAIQNFMGEASPSSLCPSHPEAFEYGLHIVEDISVTGVDEIHLESVDYAGFLHGDHHEMQAYSDTVMLDRIMGLCFCKSCLARAEQKGIPGERLREQVRRQAEAYFQFEPMPDEDSDLENRYREMRCLRVAEFYRDLKERIVQQGRNVRIKPILWLSKKSDPIQCGVNVCHHASAIDGVIAAYPERPGEVSEFLDYASRFFPGTVPVTGGVRLMAPQTVYPGQVKEYMDAYEARGVHEIIFYNYGMAPMPFLREIQRHG